MTGEGSLDAPTREIIKWQDPDFADPAKLDAEMRRVFDICHGCRRCFNLCDSFPRLFDMIDNSPSGELDGVPKEKFAEVEEACTLCDMCFMTKCPYVPPHAFNLDFPHLMLRYRAAEAKAGKSDFTQRQLMACLILRAYLKTTYRGVLELLAVSSNLREALGLGDKLPHYTTLQKFSVRSQVLAIADAMIRTIGRAAGAPKFAQGTAAMDATGLETTTASAHFQSRSGRQRRKWVKVSTIILCGSLLPLSLVLDWGPGNDKSQAKELMAKASKATLPAALKCWQWTFAPVNSASKMFRATIISSPAAGQPRKPSARLQ